MHLDIDIPMVLADDQKITRLGLKITLESIPGVRIVGEASNGQEVLIRLDKNTVDVVMLDISMPGRSGLDILKQLRSDYPKLPVLILSMYSEEQYAMRALRAGASGYLTKDSAPEELIDAIRKIFSGKKYVSASLAEKLAVYLDEGQEKPLHQALSDREYQVMCMIASGKAVKEIASNLNLSVKTISTYRSRILDKMRMKSNASLTHYAIHNQLID